MKQRSLLRILTLLMAFVMIAALIPAVPAQAADTLAAATTTLTEADVIVTEPRAGKLPDYSVRVNGSGYTAKVVNWFCGETYKDAYAIPKNLPFEAGQRYWPVIYLTPEEGYDFANYVQATINGRDATEGGFLYSDGDYIILLDFFSIQEVTSVKGDVTAPQPGHTPSYTCQVPSGANYTAKVANWFCGESFEASVLMGRNETFQSGRYYWAAIYFTPKDGYEFAKKTEVTVNGVDDPGESFLYPDGDYVVRVRFPCGVLTSAQVSVTAPVAGQMPSKTGQVPSGANYTATLGPWYNGYSSLYMDALDGPFLGGRNYTCRVVIKPEEGFIFADDAVFYINDMIFERDPTQSDPTFYPFFLSYAAANTLTSAEGELVFPVAGQKPSDICLVPKEANYTADSVSWYVDNQWMGNDKTFEAGKTYLASVWLTPKEGYHFSEYIMVTLNGYVCESRLDQNDYVRLRVKCSFTVPDVSYDITVSPSNAGAYNTGGAQVTSASVGTFVVLRSSNPDPTHYVFDRWIADSPSGLQIDSADREDGASFIMPSSDVNIRAVYKRISDTRPDSPFTDVKPTDWFYDAVLWATEENIASGTGGGTFSPNGVCTRAQAVTMLWRAAGSPAPSQTNISFTDVSESAWYYQPVLWAVENDITSGTGDNTFSPDMACTRSHIVAFLWKANGMGTAAIGNPFTDVPDNAWYRQPVLWAVENGITSGTSDTTFSPNMDCSRSQIVTFLYKAR